MRGWGIVVAALLALPVGSASAATRYAAPAGTGGVPCTEPATPCALPVAVAEAVSGDRVSIAPGTYTLSSTLVPPTDVDLIGEAGPEHPHLIAPPNGTAISGTETGMRRLRVSGTIGEPVIASYGVNAVLQELVVLQQPYGTTDRAPAVLLADSRLRDSVVVTAGSQTHGVLSYGGGVLSSTVLAPGTGSAAVGAVSGSPTVVDGSILRGGDDAAGADVATIFDDAADDPALHVRRSSFRPSRLEVAEGAPALTGPGNQDATALPPLLTADGRQLAGSPTVDAFGTTDARPDDADVDGQARQIGAAQDIGGDELARTPDLSGGRAAFPACGVRTRGVAAVSMTTGGVRPVSLRFDVRYADGSTDSFPGRTVGASAVEAREVTGTGLERRGPAPVQVTAVATNPLGESRLDVPILFEPCPQKPVPVRDGVGPRITFVAVTPKSPRRGRRPLVTVETLDDAVVDVRLEKLVPGRRKGRTCSTKVRRGPRCTRVVRVQRSTLILFGPRSIAFRLPKLGTGRYRLTVTAKDAAGDATVVKRSIVVRRR